MHPSHSGLHRPCPLSGRQELAPCLAEAYDDGRGCIHRRSYVAEAYNDVPDCSHRSPPHCHVISESILSIYRCVVGIEGPPDKFPVPGKATYIREVARYPGEAVCDRITHCHSSHRHGSPTVGLGIFRFKVYSFRSAVWCEVVRDSFWWGFRWALLHRSSVVASWSTRSL